MPSFFRDGDGHRGSCEKIRVCCKGSCSVVDAREEIDSRRYLENALRLGGSHGRDRVGRGDNSTSFLVFRPIMSLFWGSEKREMMVGAMNGCCAALARSPMSGAYYWCFARNMRRVCAVELKIPIAESGWSGSAVARAGAIRRHRGNNPIVGTIDEIVQIARRDRAEYG